ncbi:hypothetical protein EZV62_016012 [Acer yangbiense]|uniref:hAT-like transposase RNase-H fold domain-containing protein n=1 Tax=Acer yangbiense TaxID=1000413 RepID=A0A5C7HMG6_9ROSI|nr:hypothetical protein EZV62_016012 [Acer yangbiense]
MLKATKIKEGDVEIRTFKFDQDTTRRELANMVILHEYPLSMVEHCGFHRFTYVPCPHTSEMLTDVMMECLHDWNIEHKLSTLTVDNCSTNNVMIRILLEMLSDVSLLLNGDMFHMRCSTHILNLIVRDGLDVISDSVERIRSSVSY